MLKTQFALTTAMLAGLLFASSAHAGSYNTLFDNGQYVNVLAAFNATITQTGTGWGTDGAKATNLQNLVANYTDSGAWAASPTLGSSSLTLDLGTSRDVQSIHTGDQFSSAALYGFNTVKVETSPDNVNWTTQSNTVVNSGSESDINLTTDVNAQYLRITPLTANGSTGSENGGRLILNTIRVMGAPGALNDMTGNLNLVAGGDANGHGIHGNVTMTLTGGINNGVTNAQFVNEALNPIQNASNGARPVLFSIKNGSTITYQFGQLYTFNEIGIYHAPGGSSDPSGTFTISTSTDGTNYTTVFTQSATNGYPLSQMDYYALNPSVADYVRFTYTGSATDSRISDLQVFGGTAVPEPSSIVMSIVAAACGLAICWRRRRRA